VRELGLCFLKSVVCEINSKIITSEMKVLTVGEKTGGCAAAGKMRGIENATVT
jgi:hypothetical protein